MTSKATALLALGFIVLLPSAAAVHEGDPLVLWFGRDDATPFSCGPYLITANETGDIGGCGEGPAVGVQGTTTANPEDFQGNGTQRVIAIGPRGTFHMAYDNVNGPALFEVVARLSGPDGLLLAGNATCRGADGRCDVPLAGAGGHLRFPDLRLHLDFPTIVGVVTPALLYDQPDPSQLRLDGAWGAAYVTPRALPTPLALLPPGPDVALHVGAGANECLGMSLAPLPPAFCAVGGPLFPDTLGSEPWRTPRALNWSGSADVRLSLAPFDQAQPVPGSADVTVDLYSVNHASHGQAMCSYTALPATCAVHLRGRATSLAWKDRLILAFKATNVQGGPVTPFGDARDPGTITLRNATWQPDPMPAALPGEAHPARGLVAPAPVILLLGAACLTLRRRPQT